MKPSGAQNSWRRNKPPHNCGNLFGRTEILIDTKKAPQTRSEGLFYALYVFPRQTAKTAQNSKFRLCGGAGWRRVLDDDLLRRRIWPEIVGDDAYHAAAGLGINLDNHHELRPSYQGSLLIAPRKKQCPLWSSPQCRS